MVSKRTGRPGGRPKGSTKPLADLTKHQFALMQAYIDHGRKFGWSERYVAIGMARAIYALPAETPSDVAARGEQTFELLEPHLDHKDEKGPKTWRNKDAFRPLADDLRRKLRRLRSRDPDWFDAMSLAWRVCLDGIAEGEDYARMLATAAGERDFFDHKMRPVLRARAKVRRDKGLDRPELRLFEDFRRPGYFPHGAKS